MQIAKYIAIRKLCFIIIFVIVSLIMLYIVLTISGVAYGI